MMDRFVPFSFKSEHLVKINHTVLTKKIEIKMCKFLTFTFVTIRTLLKGSDFIILFHKLNFKYRGLTKYHDQKILKFFKIYQECLIIKLCQFPLNLRV